MQTQRMTPLERRAAFSLAGIFSLRMMGLFMILPVFALYAETLGKVRPPHVLVGLAIGIYGLSQALLQIPFGMLSDRFGRKPIITAGLLLFAVGSVMAATADSITGVIIGRALQGSGAIAAAVMALAADLTREEHRTKAMAVIGMSIGLSFVVSMAGGPILNSWIGVDGIFWLTAAFACVGILVLWFAVPNAPHSAVHRDTEAVAAHFGAVLRDKDLLRLDGGIFALHFTLTGSFVALPFALRDFSGVAPEHHWMIYLPVMLISLVLMVPLVIVAEKRRRIKQVFLAAILGIALAQFALTVAYHWTAGVVTALLLFFASFNLLEALLPSLIVKYAPADKKGTAMGVYSTSQFLGAFSGGVVGGWAYGALGLMGTFAASALVAVAWFLWASTMSPPRYLSSFLLRIGALPSAEAAELQRRVTAMAGVAEAVFVPEDGVAYLKVDSAVVDYRALRALAGDGEADEDDAGGRRPDAEAPASV